MSPCQQYQVCPEGSCFSAMPKSKTITPHVWLFIHSFAFNSDFGQLGIDQIKSVLSQDYWHCNLGVFRFFLLSGFFWSWGLIAVLSWLQSWSQSQITAEKPTIIIWQEFVTFTFIYFWDDYSTNFTESSKCSYKWLSTFKSKIFIQMANSLLSSLLGDSVMKATFLRVATMRLLITRIMLHHWA